MCSAQFCTVNVSNIVFERCLAKCHYLHNIRKNCCGCSTTFNEDILAYFRSSIVEVFLNFSLLSLINFNL